MQTESQPPNSQFFKKKSGKKAKRTKAKQTEETKRKDSAKKRNAKKKEKKRTEAKGKGGPHLSASGQTVLEKGKS